MVVTFGSQEYTTKLKNGCTEEPSYFRFVGIVNWIAVLSAVWYSFDVVLSSLPSSGYRGIRCVEDELILLILSTFPLTTS